MACFTAPLAQAVAVGAAAGRCSRSHNLFLRRAGWLAKMLYGGSAVLAVEHVCHGEITWRFPFLTAVAEGRTAEMLREIATNGVAMCVAVTALWAALVVVAEKADRGGAASSAAPRSAGMRAFATLALGALGAAVMWGVDLVYAAL